MRALSGSVSFKILSNSVQSHAMPVTDRLTLWWLRSNVGSYMGVELGGMSHTVLAFQPFFVFCAVRSGREPAQYRQATEL